jgi:thiamine-phosphate pyrophosphorylase
MLIDKKQMKLIAITPQEDIKDEQHHIALLIAEGFIVHCRKPGKNAVELASYLRGIAPEFRNSIAIHDHHELANDMGIKRLHFPEKMRKETTFEPGRSSTFRLSTSVHSVNALASEELGPFDYIFCAPVFDSLSKPGYAANQEWQSPMPEIPGVEKIALGGITPDKMLNISNWGFDGVGFSGYLWENPPQITEKINRIKEVWLKDLTF